MEALKSYRWHTSSDQNEKLLKKISFCSFFNPLKKIIRIENIKAWTCKKNKNRVQQASLQFCCWRWIVSSYQDNNIVVILW